MDFNGQLDILGQVILTIFIAGIVGLEREILQKPAGLRTHILIAVSAMLLVALGSPLIQAYLQNLPQAAVQGDPTRIIQAIIIGVSFIGGGVIIKHKQPDNVVNLTTAASLLLAATVGISTGLKLYWLAGGIAVLSVITNYILLQWEKQLGTNHTQR